MGETTLRWPDEVPWRMRRDGFSFAWGETRTRTEASAGPGRLRRRASVAIRPISGVLDLSPAEYARLERFWDEDTGGGVLPFWFRHPLRFSLPLVSGAAQLPLLTAAGAPLLIEAWLLCQFGEQPGDPSPLPGGRLRVSLTFAVLP